MSKLDCNSFDDDDSEEGRRDRFEDELKKYKDLYGSGGASEITSIEALESLTAINGDLSISGNVSLNSLEGLGSLILVPGSIFINNNSYNSLYLLSLVYINSLYLL
mgnify:CR=1 FL=1